MSAEWRAKFLLSKKLANNSGIAGWVERLTLRESALDSQDAGLLARARRQCVPSRERVHIVSPVRDFSVFNLDD